MLRINKFRTAVAIFAFASAAIAQSAAKAPESKLFDAGKMLEDVRTLSADDMEGRSAERPTMAKARDYIKKRFAEAGLKPFGSAFEQEFELRGRGQTGAIKGVNYVGLIEGEAKAGKYIVVTAHYDHLGVRNGQIFNGADDNASGTAALFAIASYFKKHQPEHPMIFAAFDAEEKGLIGARHLAAILSADSVLLNVNMDMISRNNKNELYAAGTFHYPQFRPTLERVQRIAKVKLLLGHDDPKLGMGDWTNQSDHAAFHAAKIPFIYFGVEDHKDYHKSTDDFANIQPEFYVKAVETIVEALKEFDTGLNK